MKVLYITDTHLTPKAPESRIDNYEITTYRKMLEIKEIIKKYNVDILIHGGDMFHSAKISLKYAGIIGQILKSYGIPIYVVPGNHDIFGYNCSTVYQTVLGLFERLGIVNILSRDNSALINVGNCTLSLEGQEYYPNIDKGNMDDFRIENRLADYKILVYHGMLLDKPFLENVPHTLIKDVQTDADLVLAGHYHPGFKAQINDGTFYMNPGSVLRVECSRLDMPKVALFTFEEKNGNIVPSCKYIYLSSAAEREYVFDITKKEEKAVATSQIQILKNEIDNLSINQKPVNFNNIMNDIATQLNYTQEDKDLANQFVSSAHQNILDVDLFANGYVDKSNPIYIKEVEIKNFQSHKHTVLNFCNGLNVINGESGKGKSAILRAIAWCVYGEPRGNNFIRTGTKKCSVKLTFSDNSSIERSRTLKGSSKYIVTDVNGNSQEYSGFGNNIPIDVINQHQMPVVHLGKDFTAKLNYSSQIEPPFLIGQTNSIKAEAIGRLIGTNIYDDAVKECKSKILNIKKEISIREQNLNMSKDNLSKYDNLDKLKLYIDFIKACKSVIDKKASDNNKLTNLDNNRNALLSNYDNTKKLIKHYNDILNKSSLNEQINILLQKTNELYIKFDKVTQLNNKLLSLKAQKEETINKIKSLTIDITDDDLNKQLNLINSTKAMVDCYNKISSLTIKQNNIINRLNNLQLSKDTDDIMQNVYNKLTSLKEIHDLYIRKITLNNQEESYNNNLKSFEENIKSIEKENISLKKKLIDSGIEKEKCPLCGSPLTINHIFNEE